jgi:DNA-binding MarR family transcriptional regulator
VHIHVSMANDIQLADCADCLCLASRRAARTITRAFDHELRAFGIRSTQFSLLSLLELKGPQSIGDLAESLGADRTTLTRNLALLEKQSLIKIRPGDDARARIVSIMPKGKSTVAHSFPAWRKAQMAMTASLGGEMVKSLHRLAQASSK